MIDVCFAITWENVQGTALNVAHLRGLQLLTDTEY
jgi:hypothetical protein